MEFCSANIQYLSCNNVNGAFLFSSYNNQRTNYGKLSVTREEMVNTIDYHNIKIMNPAGRDEAVEREDV